MNKALLDTDIYSEVLKAIDPNVGRNAAAYRQHHGNLTVSVVSVMEIVRGFQRVGRAQRVRDFLDAVIAEEILDFQQDAAELAGRIDGELERVGLRIGLADTVIAAIALRHGLDLATGNTAHFLRVQQLGYPLTLVNWRT